MPSVEYRYQPLPGKLQEWRPEDLAVLRDVSEGWYVDYKSGVMSARVIGKHLSAFANQFGGWLFFGVEETRDAERKAAGFPGIPNEDLELLVNRVREGAIHQCSPHVVYEERLFHGPIPELGLPERRAILAIGIPEGYQCPYVHSSGRIYRRLADSSDPTHETDYAVVRDLLSKSERARQRLEEFTSTTYTRAKSEDEIPWVEVFLIRDSLLRPEYFDLTLDRFREILVDASHRPGIRVPFDNFFPARGGFVARQVAGNDPFFRTATLRWWRSGNVRISLPLSVFDGMHNAQLEARYRSAARFYEIAEKWGFSSPKAVDVTTLLHMLGGLIASFEALRAALGDTTNLVFRVIIENTWRVSAFIDSEAYLSRCDTLGIPVVEEKDVAFPHEVDFDSLIPLELIDPESQSVPEGMGSYLPGSLLALPILCALGVVSKPHDLLDYGLFDPTGRCCARPDPT